VQRFRKLDRGSGWHELIMPQLRMGGWPHRRCLQIICIEGSTMILGEENAEPEGERPRY
jgi:hypothetical protein